MLTIADLVKVRHDLISFGGHFKVTNVKIDKIFLMVRGNHGVTTKHQWEVDTGLSESAKKIDFG